MNIRKNIPDFFTALNLLAGCFGMVALFEDRPAVAVSMIIAGAVFDFLDGFFARYLNAFSAMGKELDSLADLITFGLLPAFIMFYIMQGSTSGYYPYFSFIMVIAAAFRLARFNTAAGPQDDFEGLPTPANAFFVAGLMNIYLGGWNSFFYFFSNPNLLAVVVFILSYLMISDIRFLSLKFRNMAWKENVYRYTVLLAGIILVVFMQLDGIFFAILFYIVLSIIRHFALMLKTHSS